MGYIRHHTIVVTGYVENLSKAHQLAKEIFGSLVSEIIQSNVNGYESFFVAPDGSKEGWEESDNGDKNRQKFIDEVADVDYVELFFGDDNGESKIENHT